MKKKFLFLCILTSSICFGQSNRLDSINLSNASHYSNINNDSLLYYAKQLQLSKNKCIRFKGVEREAIAYYKMGDFLKSKQLTETLLDKISLFEEPCFKSLKIYAYNRLFWIYKNTNQPLKAFQVAEKTNLIIKSFEKKDVNYRRALLSNKSNIASIKLELGLFDEAKNIYEEINSEISQIIPQLNGVELYSSLIFKSSVLNLTGEVFLKLSSDKNNSFIDSAFVYYKKAFDVTQLFNPPHKNSKPLYDLKRAKILVKKEEYLNALKIIDDNNLFKDDINITQEMSFLKSVIFHNLKEVDSSLYYSHKFIRFKKKTPSTEKNRVVVLNILADEYKNLNRADSALKYSYLALNHLNDLTEKKSEANNSHYLYDFNKVRDLNKIILDTQKTK
ncbi:MAG: hypothetical protein JKY02_10875, partial [Flavobacteriaceae bacterium]|nr:hypothetical protein [Flavobacteriaceae bacterium]